MILILLFIIAIIYLFEYFNKYIDFTNIFIFDEPEEQFFYESKYCIGNNLG
jgi:hypothetical protein